MPIKEYPRTVCRIPLRYRVCLRQEKESLEEPDLEWELRLDPQAAPGSMQGGEQGGCMRGCGRFTGRLWRELRRQGGAGNAKVPTVLLSRVL